MDLDSTERAQIRSSVYRVSIKLLNLQRLCHMDRVLIRHVTAALHFVGGAELQRDMELSKEEVMQVVTRMFHDVSQEVPDHVTVEAAEELCSLMFRLYERSPAALVPLHSLQTALIVLTGDTLQLKYAALLAVVTETSSGSVTRSGLRSLLEDISQVPAAVQEQGVFGDVEAAVKSCFNGVLRPTAGEERVLSWLQSEPRLLLWLPTLYRLSVSQNVNHQVRCHTCKTFPITGLRYRCRKCVNVHLCQSCFLNDKQTRKHKPRHPVVEFCTQPTWKESVSSLVHSARHVLLPWRYTQRQAGRRMGLMWAEPGETQDRAPPSSDASAVSHTPSQNASVRPFTSKAQQTDVETLPQQWTPSSLLDDVRTLQRDKWLMERQLQVWRLTVQSEQGILEDRCSEMEVTVETLREHNRCLQAKLEQALNKMEAQQHNNTSSTEEEEEEEEEQQTTPTMHQDTPQSHDSHCEKEKEQQTTPTMHQDTPQSHDSHCEKEKEQQTTPTMHQDTPQSHDSHCEEKEQQTTPTMHQDTPQSHDSHCEKEKEQQTTPTMHQDTPQSHDSHCEKEKEQQTTPTMHQDTPQSHDSHCEKEKEQQTTPTMHQDTPQSHDSHCEATRCLPAEEDDGTCSLEELLQQTVDRLKTAMETDRWTHRQTGVRKWEELLAAADLLGDSLHHLVDAVRTDRFSL